MRGLLADDPEYKKLAKKMKESFVFLNVYCQSVEDEHKPRGPEGPYQFNDKSVPVLVLKKWDGETIVQNLGFYADPKVGKPQLERHVEKALKENGPIVPPKTLRPLMKDFAAGEKSLEKARVGSAWKAFAKVVKAGKDGKKFPDGPPDIAKRAQKHLDAILKQADEAIAAVDDLDDDADRKKGYRKLLRTYNGVPEIKKRLRTAIKALP